MDVSSTLETTAIAKPDAWLSRQERAVLLKRRELMTRT